MSLEAGHRPLMRMRYEIVEIPPIRPKSACVWLVSLRGSLTQSPSLLQLLSRRVSHVVSITNTDVSFPSDKLKHLQIWLEDESDSDLASNFERIFEFMREAVALNGAVLVHCEAGISRSATTVIAYLVKYHSMSLEQAFRHTKERRRIINPNSGFVEQLRQFEASMQPTSPYDPFPFVFYWLKTFVYSLKDISEDEARKGWIASGNDLSRTWQILSEEYEERYLLPTISKNNKQNVHTK